jgi:proline iminopeptidase
MPPSEGFVTTEDGARLFFQSRGHGPHAVVIPNGLYLWDDFEPLAKGRLLIVYDLRNRGRSDRVTECSIRRGGILDDVLDLEEVRRHFGFAQISLIGHSYVGLLVVLYAMKYALHVGRAVQVGPIQPFSGTQYPVHLTGADATFQDVFSRLAELQKQRDSFDPEAFCRKFWSVLRLIYVTDPADADRIDWGRCELPNERSSMKYLTQTVFPSIQSLSLSADDLARVETPVLILHGTKDRSTPYGGGREWALRLANARLVTLENAGHAPWIEAPERTFASIETFLQGWWPEGAEKVESLDCHARRGPAGAAALKVAPGEAAGRRWGV